MTDDETPKVYYPLSVVMDEPVQDVIATLEDALLRARSGEVIGVGIVMACRGRCDATAYALGEGDIATLVLSAERLKARLLEIE